MSRDGSGSPRDGTVGRPPLYTKAFLGLCAIVLLGFGQNYILQPVIPILVLDRGGDAAFAGLTFAVFTIPSVVLRPAIGSLADRWGSRRILLVGLAGIALAAPLHLLPSLALILVVRAIHGTVWAAFTTGSASLLARLAPVARRGEASGAFDLMPGIAILVAPSIGLLLNEQLGVDAPFVFALFVGLAALVVGVLFIPNIAPAPRTGAGPTGWRAILEPSAVLPMGFQILFMSVASLFVVYPPLLATSLGIPLSDMVAYYTAYGLALVIVRAAAGRLLDRVPRAAVIAAGGGLAAVALVLAATADSLGPLVLAGILYASAQGFSSPAMLASVIDRAPPSRLGAAMATYTLGFQFGNGLGAALWGALIGPFGFVWPYLIGAAVQVALVVVTLARRGTIGRPQPA